MLKPSEPSPRFPDLLAVEQEHRAIAEKEVQGSQLVTCVRGTEPGISRGRVAAVVPVADDRRRDPPLVMVFQVSQTARPLRGGDRGDLPVVIILGPRTLVYPFQGVVGVGVVDRVETGGRQVVEVVDGDGAVAGRVRFGEEVDVRIASPRSYR